MIVISIEADKLECTSLKDLCLVKLSEYIQYNVAGEWFLESIGFNAELNYVVVELVPRR